MKAVRLANPRNEASEMIYRLGVEAVFLIKEGDLAGLKVNMAKARKLGVEIADTAFDDLIEKFAPKTEATSPPAK